MCMTKPPARFYQSHRGSWMTWLLPSLRRGHWWRKAASMIDGAKRKGSSVLLACALVIVFSPFSGFAEDGNSITPNDPHHNDPRKDFWPSLIAQAKTAGLPTRFLLAIDPSFVTLEFDDLHAFAAEYHPEDHQLILNRSLSFNAAG